MPGFLKGSVPVIRLRPGSRLAATVLLLFLICNLAAAQTGQLDITRVQLMPNLPSPYLMRNWKDVAFKYDSIVYSLNATGQYLPVMHLKSSGINYPSLQPILMDSYVGSASGGNQAESINIIPSLVGATLVGIDKSNQNGTNWVEKAKDFFNKANGQNVYLNGASSTSGSDWWYDLMPNVFFYQLYSQYPDTQDFDSQFTTIADRWLGAVKAMGGSTTPWSLPQMDYRGFNLATSTPNASGVTEPESAGTLGWLLYHAYLKTGNKKYLDGAQMAIGFLSNYGSNPAYEIQLPYGSFIAAKMNAELGTNFDIQKMVNWSFDQSSKRNWGTIVGSWGDAGNIDVSGLVGEVDNPSTGYAFAMNGFEQAAALVPLVKYDKRFARSIGKWVLNLANASRLFYSQYLPSDHQDDFTWCSTYDPHAAISYEALKQTINSQNLVGTGDAKRNGWAQTNLGLYGASHVGYLAALVDSTNVDGILLLDVNKTDFFGKNTFPTYLMFNPYNSGQQVTIPLGAQTRDIYDAISETVIKSSATGNTQINIPANEAMLLVYLPAGSTPVATGGKLYVNEDVVDFHYGYDFTGKFRIQSLAVTDTLVEFNDQVPVYSSVENAGGTVTYNWYINNVLESTTSTPGYTWSVPSVEGYYTVRLNAVSGAAVAQDSLMLHVVQHIPAPPVVTGITSDMPWYHTGQLASLLCHATSNTGPGTLRYKWTLPPGSIVSQTDSLIQWTLPAVEGLYPVACEVANADSLKTTVTNGVLVKKPASGSTTPLAYYPFDGDVLDYSGNGFNGVLQGAQQADDALGEPDKAYHFASSNDVIYVPNNATLNFTDQITLGFWLNVDAVPQECYVLSHGSYEERWKVSVIQNGKLRWTVKTSSSTKDLDTSFPLQTGTFYHFTVVYSGYSMEIYSNGVLDTFLADAGPMLTTSKAIAFGKKDVGINNYYLRGTLDEVRIYDKALEPEEIATLKTLWNHTTALPERQGLLAVYPNPANSMIMVSGLGHPVMDVHLVDMTGQEMSITYSYREDDDVLVATTGKAASGLFILKIETEAGTVFRKVMIVN